METIGISFLLGYPNICNAMNTSILMGLLMAAMQLLRWYCCDLGNPFRWAAVRGLGCSGIQGSEVWGSGKRPHYSGGGLGVGGFGFQAYGLKVNSEYRNPPKVRIMAQHT